MLQKELIEIFRELGWKIHRGLDLECTYDLGDRIVSTLPSFDRGYPDNKMRFRTMDSVGIKEFSRCVAIIGNVDTRTPKSKFDAFFQIVQPEYPSIFHGKEKELTRKEFTKEDIEGFTKEIIEWGKIQNIEEGLKKYRELKTSSPGIYPLFHIASLSLVKDKSKLEYYKKCFEKGDRLGFVPYITQAYIDKAFEISLRENDEVLFKKR